jgi:hypothetical protein
MARANAATNDVQTIVLQNYAAEAVGNILNEAAQTNQTIRRKP